MWSGGRRYTRLVYTSQQSDTAVVKKERKEKKIRFAENLKAISLRCTKTALVQRFYLGMIKWTVHLLALWEEATDAGRLGLLHCCKHKGQG